MLKPEAEAEPESLPVKQDASLPTLEGLSLPCSRDKLTAEQKADSTLHPLFQSVVSDKQRDNSHVCYFLDDGLLMRKWSPYASLNLTLNAIYQIVVPISYRESILAVAHESNWSGHLGVTKIYQSLLKQFFWPGMKKDVTGSAVMGRISAAPVTLVSLWENQIKLSHKLPSTLFLHWINPLTVCSLIV